MVEEFVVITPQDVGQRVVISISRGDRSADAGAGGRVLIYRAICRVVLQELRRSVPSASPAASGLLTAVVAVAPP